MPSDEYNVVLVNNPQGLTEAAEAIYYGLLEAGHNAVLTRGLTGLQSFPERRRIVFGVYLGRLLRERMPKVHWSSIIRERDIIYNSEQLRDVVVERYEITSMLASRTVWDYSSRNVEFLIDLGCPNPVLVPLGSVQALKRITLSEPDADVMFYGLINPRRSKILEALQDEGVLCRIHGKSNPVWGQTRDELIGRTKVILNVHFYDYKIFEAFRLNYLLLNGCCVVSENGLDPVENLYEKAAVFCPYDQLVQTCLQYVRDSALRQAQSARAIEAMANIRQADILFQVLKEETIRASAARS